MADTGWLSFTNVGQSDIGGSDAVWGSLDLTLDTEIRTSDGNLAGGNGGYAYTGASSGALQTKFLYGTQLMSVPTEFSSPSSDMVVIQGIQVRIEKNSTNCGSVYWYDSHVQLWDGGRMGDNKASGTAWPMYPAADSIVVYGGETDTWGLSLTQAQILGSSFGAGVRATKGASLSCRPYVDMIQMKIYYELKPSGMFLTI